VLGRQRAEAQERESTCARALAEATALMRGRLFAEAAAALAVARAAQPESPAVRALEDELEAARLEAERTTERQRRTAQAIAAARHEFAAGRRRDAIETLESFARQQPDATGVREEAARLEAEARRLQEAERRAAEAAAHAEAAEAALANNDPTQALARADRALALEPGQARAARVHALAAAQIKAAAERKARAESAARLLGEARDEMARKRFKKARSLVQQADALAPGSDEAAAVLTAIGEREAQAAADEERARIAAARARAAAPALALARAAEARDDFVRAAWLAENALALDHDCADARDLLERCRARLAAQPALADETVDLVKEPGRATDPEDTVNIGRALPPWRRVADAIRSWSAGDAPPRASHSGDDVRRRSKARF
jgi:tetratricopeptide (TPR) repeat protein